MQESYPRLHETLAGLHDRAICIDRSHAVNGRLKVFIVGGYGTFGGRLVELLRDEARLTLFVAGRSLAQATAFCERMVSQSQLTPVYFDRNGDLEAQLAAHAPHLLVDASGPFQAYGKQPYRLIEACITRGINYLDLADGADFVQGVHTLDAAARARNVFVLSGVSSFPVLTAAVVRRLSQGLVSVDAICGGIAPVRAGIGLNVVRAVAGYAGSPIRLWRDGHVVTGYGFLEQRRATIAPPGRLPLRSTLFSLVDVPDLQALPQLWPGVRSVWMGAGPVPEVLHRALIAMAWLRRARLIPPLTVFARLLHFAASHLQWGEHRGGMFVSVDGVDSDGKAVTRSWHLLAEGDDGPFIPSMAAESLIRKLIDGGRPPTGARSGARDLELADYERLFARRTISTGFREAAPSDATLYARILGSAWHDLPAQIRSMHDVKREHVAAGMASVTRGTRLIARCVAAFIGFPQSAAQTPVRVRFQAAGGVERWTRSFGDRSFYSEQSAGRGREDGLVVERFGPFCVALALLHEGRHLRLVVRRWRFLALPLPLWLAPVCDSYESVEDGRFRFHVEISHPSAGLIVRYDGWLLAVPDSSC